MGKAGAGKSTLINHIYNALCKAHYDEKGKKLKKMKRKKEKEKMKKMLNPAKVSINEVTDDTRFFNITDFVEKRGRCKDGRVLRKLK